MDKPFLYYPADYSDLEQALLNRLDPEEDEDGREQDLRGVIC